MVAWLKSLFTVPNGGFGSYLEPEKRFYNRILGLFFVQFDEGVFL